MQNVAGNVGMLKELLGVLQAVPSVLQPASIGRGVPLPSLPGQQRSGLTPKQFDELGEIWSNALQLQPIGSTFYGYELGQWPRPFGGGRMGRGTTGSWRHPDEAQFQQWYQGLVQRRAKMGRPLGNDPYDPRQNYDYYALYQAVKSGQMKFPPDNWENMGPDTGHFPSPFKSDENNHVIVNGVDTRNGQRVAAPTYTGPYRPGQMPPP